MVEQNNISSGDDRSTNVFTTS